MRQLTKIFFACWFCFGRRIKVSCNFYFLHFEDLQKWYCGDNNLAFFAFSEKQSSGLLVALPMAEIPIINNKEYGPWTTTCIVQCIPSGLGTGMELFSVPFERYYRVDGHLVDLNFVAIKVGSSSYPAGQQGSYSNSPPASGIF